MHFDETAADPPPSEEFIENLIEYVNGSQTLNHLDISGLNLGRDYNPDKYHYQYDVERHNSTAPILALAVALAQSDYLLGIHLSDNGLRADEELLLEVLDMFGLDEKSLE